MAVFSVVTFQVKPGRRDQFLADAKELKGIVERLGVNLTRIRLTQATVAGPASGNLLMVFEYADLGSWGASVDNQMKDPAWQALGAKVFGPDGAATLVSRTLLTEIPL